MHLVPGILASSEDATLIQMTKSVCEPILGLAPKRLDEPLSWSDGCLQFNDQVAQWIAQSDSVRFAVLGSTFAHFFIDGWKAVSAAGVIDPDESLVYQHLSATLDFLISHDVQPVIVSPPLSNGTDIGACLVRASSFGKALRTCDIPVDQKDQSQQLAHQVLTRLDEDYRVIWLEDFLCEGSTCKAAIGDVFIYRDAGHLSHEGSRLIGHRMGFFDRITATQQP